MLAAVTATVAHAAAGKVKPAHFSVLGHANPAGGYSGDVVGERHFAYLSSHRGQSDCPAQGVRVYDIANPRKPRRISTFGRITGTWTEKTIVRRVHTSGFDGVLAVTSVQACENGFGGFALYDVTRPAHPRVLALVPTEPRGSHEIWLATARGHAWVYTAEAAAEFSVEPSSFGFHVYDVSRPHAPGRGRRLERLQGAPPVQPAVPAARQGRADPRPFRDHERGRDARVPLVLEPRDGDPRHLQPGQAALPRSDRQGPRGTHPPPG